MDGVLKFAPTAPWNASSFAASGVAMYASLALASNCSVSGAPTGCWSMGDSCNAALARADAFSAEVLVARVISEISDCHFAVQLNHFTPGFRSHSVAMSLK